VFGGDRKLMLMALCVSVGMMFISMNIFSFVLGLVIGLISVYGLRKMAKADPLMWQVYMRQVNYAGHYSPFSRPWRVAKTSRIY
jgi:type IV secretion system protein VirB3